MQFEIKFSGDNHPNSIHCVVIGRSGVAFNRKFNIFVNEEGLADIGLTVLGSMVPSSRFIFYYFQKLGEIIFDQTKVEIPSAALNTVSRFIIKITTNDFIRISNFSIEPVF